MLMLLSPAKNLDFTPVDHLPAPTRPRLLADTKALSQVTAQLRTGDLKRLMNISDQLAQLNYERFQMFKAGERGAQKKQAALAFNGDVYLGLDAKTLDADTLSFAQDHLRILSGLYGALRPLDAIEPYRLEMGTRLKTARGTSLYDFWGDKVSIEINKALKDHGDPTVVNLASNEYFSVVTKGALKAPIVTPIFKEEKDGKLRQLQFFAKRARGLMARWALEHRLTDHRDLRGFDSEGYRLNEGESSDDRWVFTRPQPAPKPPAKKATKKR
ncbi:MAG: peroxide stress protein YaaA [Pseudomonadota bacterium]